MIQKIYTDGSPVGGNSLKTCKKVGLGVYIPGKGKFHKVEEGSSNNEAEFKALLWGVRLAIHFKFRKVQFYADSKIIVNRANGRRPHGIYRNERMNALQDELTELRRDNFDFISFTWVPRELNHVANTLAKLYKVKKSGLVNRKALG